MDIQIYVYIESTLLGKTPQILGPTAMGPRALHALQLAHTIATPLIQNK